MGRYYTKPKISGAEYVYTVEDLVNITIDRCGKLPKKWGKYFLDPLVDTVNQLDALVHKANNVFVNPDKQTAEEYIDALKRRISLLQQCKEDFAVFDRDFDKLLMHVDFVYSEKTRMKRLLLETIKEVETEKSGKIVLEGRLGENDFSYVSVNGNHTAKLMLTRSNVDHWLDTRNKAETLVNERLRKDKGLLRNQKQADNSRQSKTT